MQAIRNAALAVLSFLLLSGFSYERHEFPVVLVDAATGAAVPCTVVGHLYYQDSFRNRPLQVAVHGVTYDHTYWHFPSVNGQDYSYARYMAQRGHAVLAIDQVGAGESCTPDGVTVVHLQNTASALVQVLLALRRGTGTPGVAFDRIALVGHSTGAVSAIAAQAATGSQLADALVVTAARHLDVLPRVFALMTIPYSPLDPATRASLFFDAAHADPGVIAVDNALADLWTGGQVRLAPFHGADAVTGPVLIQLGENDALFPASRPERESAFWGRTRPRIESLPYMGHAFNLHLARESSWRGIDRWLKEVLG